MVQESEKRNSGESRRVISAEELRGQVQDYIAQCAEAELFPDYAGMRIFLGLSREELEKISEDKDCKSVLDYAADCRESWLVRRMTQDNKVTTGCINALRQSENGGYTDKPQTEKRLLIQFSGSMEPEDFK